MKKITCALIMATSLFAIFTGCKKNKDKDYQASIKNTIWVGEIKYTSKSYVEPFSVNFKGDGTFTWHEFSGNYDGTYTMDNGSGELSVEFSTGSSFTSRITEDDKLTNFVYGQNSWELRNTELNTTSDQSLDNSIWNGTYNGGGSIIINFKSNSKVMAPGYPNPTQKTYSRLNGTIRYDGEGQIHSFKYFLVIQNNGSIKGIEEKHDLVFLEYYYSPFTVSKQ